MIDRTLRTQLSQDLRKLVTGRMTNDQFDDVYYDIYANADDPAVQEVAAFGYGLYSSDLLFPYRLKGRHAISRETRRTAARCILLLRTECDYEWPSRPSTTRTQLACAIAWYGIPAGIAVLLCCLMLLVTRTKGLQFMIPVGIAAAIWLAWSLWYWNRGAAARWASPEWRAWRSSGDYDAWPLFRREDFYAARRTRHLIGAATAPQDRGS